MFGLVSLVSMDCTTPWRLQVNSELSWFHFISPLMLLLLYNTVAGLWRNQVMSLVHHWSELYMPFCKPIINRQELEL